MQDLDAKRKVELPTDASQWLQETDDMGFDLWETLGWRWPQTHLRRGPDMGRLQFAMWGGSGRKVGWECATRMWGVDLLHATFFQGSADTHVFVMETMHSTINFPDCLNNVMLAKIRCNRLGLGSGQAQVGLGRLALSSPSGMRSAATCWLGMEWMSSPPHPPTHTHPHPHLCCKQSANYDKYPTLNTTLTEVSQVPSGLNTTTAHPIK